MVRVLESSNRQTNSKHVENSIGSIKTPPENIGTKEMKLHQQDSFPS